MENTKQYYTTKEAAQLLGVTPRHIRDMCDSGKITGAYQIQGKRGKEWRIPAEGMTELLANKEVEVEVLPPEYSGLVPQETLRNFVMSIIEEERGRHQEEIAELKNEIEELRQEKTELLKVVMAEVGRNSEEIGEVRKDVAERVENIREEVGRKAAEDAETVKNIKEELGRKQEDIEEVRKNVKKLKEEAGRSQEEVAEVRQEIAEWERKLEEQNRRSWWRKLFRK